MCICYNPQNMNRLLAGIEVAPDTNLGRKDMTKYEEKFDDLIQRMENIEEKKEEHKKRVLEEYNSTKNSPVYYRKNAYEKLRKTIKDKSSLEEFLLYMDTNIQRMSIDEYLALEDIFHVLRVSREQCEDKCNDK